MYPNTALSAVELTVIAVVPVLCLAIWLIGVFVAARDQGRETGAGASSLPQSPAAADESPRQAA